MSSKRAPSSLSVRRAGRSTLYWTCVCPVLVLNVVVSDKATDRLLLAALLVVASVTTAFSFRSGLTLTESDAVVRRWRVRRIAWRDVQGVVQERSLGGRRLVLWTATERIPLPELSTVLGLGRERVEEDYHRIGQWWLSHRGAEWTPVRTATPPPAVRRYFDADGNEIPPPAHVAAEAAHHTS